MSFPLDQVNVGAAPNDGTGDDLRQAFQKINALLAAAPYGGIVDTGSNANGNYVRWAAGFQLCWTRITLEYSSAKYLKATWTFPKAFKSGTQPLVITGPLPTGGASYGGGLNLNLLGGPFPVAGLGDSIVEVGYYNRDSPFSAGHKISNVPLYAWGYWDPDNP